MISFVSWDWHVNVSHVCIRSASFNFSFRSSPPRYETKFRSLFLGY